MITTESVWDYPRPPRLEKSTSHLRVLHCGIVLAETSSAFRVLETSHPPVYYIAQSDIAMEWLRPASRPASYCEFKGSAKYWTIAIGREGSAEKACLSEDAAWSYSNPTPAYAALRNHLAFYAGKVDECQVDREIVIAQPGDFYGGWITSRIVGPFKGGRGTLGW